MLTKSITYTDFFGRTKTEEFYFNLTKTELVQMSAGDFKDTLQKIASDTDDKTVVEMLRGLILNSYGHITMDGSRFEKSEALKQEFEQSAAYDALFMELAQNPEKFQEFFMNVVPADMRAEFAKSFTEANPALTAAE